MCWCRRGVERLRYILYLFRVVIDEGTVCSRRQVDADVRLSDYF